MNAQLSKEVRILVVTSRFHTLRSLFYFEQVFGNQYEIAVHGVRTTYSDTEKISMHEMMSAYKSVNTLGIFNQESPLDDQDILLKIFQHHTLYQNRYDLIRKFLKIAES